MKPEERQAMGKRGADHVDKNYNFSNFQDRWVNLMLEVHEKYGSWDSRKNYNCWEVIDL